MDQQEAWLASTVRKHGWAIQYVGGEECGVPGCKCPPSDQPPFAYTVGLTGLSHPELVIVGVDPGTAAGVLNDLGERVRRGEALVAGQAVTFESWPHRVVPETLPNPGHILLSANSFYRRPPKYSVEAMQLSYDDLEGRFPWEAGYSAPHLQPRPGTWSADDSGRAKCRRKRK
jgi:hypothetical protein